ncbi:MAG: hypothetical protein D6702_08215 [Planctomycetota bacterium]|nr:MAG: hypothetical protein D6702_08215 [Planctomycetota bacterium]
MEKPWKPADFGELGLRHEVNVFVFRVTATGLEYLLLQPPPRQEEVWRPVVHPVQLDEDLWEAAVRGVRAETGIDRPFDLVGVGPAPVLDIGDLRLVGWPFGFQVRDPLCPVRDRGRLAGYSWQRFEDALRVMPIAIHRQNLLQVHWRLLDHAA